MISEFELIDLFNHIGSKYNKQNGIVVPPGDDCAVIDLPLPLVTSIDSSISDIHFPANASAKDIGYRSVAVALSDIAAMGCQPRGFSVSITCSNRDKNWFEELANGFEDISNEFQISLIGGDVTRGPLNINVVVYGTPYNSIYLKRSGAKKGDIICITKPVGRAKKGLEDFKENNLKSNFLNDYLRPKPQIELGKKISNYATSCIDISDGLLADLNHILTSSKVGASIFLDDIPTTSNINDINAGDDYDLCFTIPAEMMDSSFYKIGEITEELGIKFNSNKGYDVSIKGFDHFKNE